MTRQTFTPSVHSRAVQKAQKTLRDFWDDARKKGSDGNPHHLKPGDRHRLVEIEKHLLNALRLLAAKNTRH